MRIIARSTLRKFWEAYPDAEQPLKAWFDEASRAEWDSPANIKTIYRNASIIANTALPAAMKYILKAESDDRRRATRKLYCIIAGSAVTVLFLI